MAKKIQITRTATIPDVNRVMRYEKNPEYGPKLLFFSGGTALTDLSRVLKRFTHNSVHMVTPFDSGGSSAVLRDAFDMPAIGDLRSRLMALADDTIGGNPEIVRLFAYRLPKDAKKKDLKAQLRALAEGKDPLVAVVKNPMRRLIRNHLISFLEIMPKDFNLKGASIGNLILAAGYLANDRRLDQVLFMFSRLVNVRGKVAPLVDQSLHLKGVLEDGRTVLGQHNMTGKEEAPISSPIARLELISGLRGGQKVEVDLPGKNRKLIHEAELICYPPGSFYTSICANFLPKGVGKAIATNPCPKVYAPGLGTDPERLGLSIDQSIFKLIEFLKVGMENDCPTSRLLNIVLIDSENGEGLKRNTKSRLRKAGVEVIDTSLVSPQNQPYYDPQKLAIVLLSLA